MNLLSKVFGISLLFLNLISCSSSQSCIENKIVGRWLIESRSNSYELYNFKSNQTLLISGSQVSDNGLKRGDILYHWKVDGDELILVGQKEKHKFKIQFEKKKLILYLDGSSNEKEKLTFHRK